MIAPERGELQIAWPAPSVGPWLDSEEIHVWAVKLSASPERVDALATVLSPEELERAGQFGPPHLRNHYIVARGGLRQLLGDYLSLPPSAVQLNYGVRGKPELAGPQPGLHFNVSHSGDLALIAITRAAPVGVDVEHLRPRRDLERLVERFFSAGESREFARLPESMRPEAFFNLWTRKEAWLKATGAGISDSLARFEVSFRPAEMPRVRAIDGNAAAGAQWSLFALSPAAAYVGALAIRQAGLRLRCWEFTAAQVQTPGSFSR